MQGILNSPQATTVRAVAQRYNSGERMRLFDGWRLNRAFQRTPATSERFMLAKLFVEGIRGRSEKKSRELVDETAELAPELEKPRSRARLLGFFLRNKRKFFSSHMTMCFSSEIRTASNRVDVSTPFVPAFIETEEGRQALVQLMVDRLSFQTLAKTMMKASIAVSVLDGGSFFFASLVLNDVLLYLASRGIEREPASLFSVLALPIAAILFVNALFANSIRNLKASLDFLTPNEVKCVACKHLKINEKPREDLRS